MGTPRVDSCLINQLILHGLQHRVIADTGSIHPAKQYAKAEATRNSFLASKNAHFRCSYTNAVNEWFFWHQILISELCQIIPQFYIFVAETIALIRLENFLDIVKIDGYIWVKMGIETSCCSLFPVRVPAKWVVSYAVMVARLKSQEYDLQINGVPQYV